MDGLHPKIWMSVQEAAEYLSCSEESVERRLLKMPAQFERGRLRFRRLDDWNALSTAERQRATPLRLLGADVYELLPLPEMELTHFTPGGQIAERTDATAETQGRFQ